MRTPRTWIWIVATVVVAVVVGVGATALASSDAPAASTRRLVTVAGTATVSTRPDEAVVELGVRSEATDAAAAMSANAQKMAAILRALGEAGVDRPDVSTLNVSLGRVVLDRGTSAERTVFRAENVVRVTITDLESAGAVIDAAVRAGADQVRDIRFQVSDPSEVRRRALRQAVLSSRAKATAMTEAAGASVGDVVSIREQAVSAPVLRYPSAAAIAFDATTPVLPTRDIETRVTVAVVWSLA